MLLAVATLACDREAVEGKSRAVEAPAIARDEARSSSESLAGRAGAGTIAPRLAQIELAGDFTIAQYEPLVAGGQVRIQYEGYRLNSCRGDLPGGGPGWTITLFSSVDGGPARSDEILGHSATGRTLDGTLILDLPSSGAHDLALWFQVTNAWGCMAWDSDQGRNYHFRVLADSGSALHFRPDFTDALSGTLRAGEGTLIDYDLARLPRCRQTYSGLPTWSVVAYYRLNGGPVQHAVLNRLSGGTSLRPWIAFPPGTSSLEMWFQNTDRTGCQDWDSRFGMNYHYSIRPDASMPWIGNGSVLITRGSCGAACPFQPLEGGFSFDTWARERADTARIYFEVWKPGVTDFDNPDLWQELDVEVLSRIGDQNPLVAQFVNFDSRAGNNARYAFDLRPLDPLGGAPGGGPLTSTSDCPTFPTTFSADGQYIQTDFQYFIRVNGAELRPAPGDVFHGAFSNYRALYAICEGP